MKKTETLAKMILDIIESYDWDCEKREEVLKDVLDCLKNYENAQSDEDFTHKEIFERIRSFCDGFEKETEIITEEQFEVKCMDVIELVVKFDRNNTREDAILLTEFLCEQAKEKSCSKSQKIFMRVLKEFNAATDAEYEALRAQIHH